MTEIERVGGRVIEMARSFIIKSINKYVTGYLPARGGVVTLMGSFLKFLTSTWRNLSSTTNRSLIVSGVDEI